MNSSLHDRILKGDIRAAARLMRLVDDGDPQSRDVMSALFPHTGNAYVLGVTGNPGSGKSTLVNHLISRFRERELTVGCVAVDPTSPFSGGAILGDRVRMQKHATDEGVFIRSVATRGHMGGLSRSTPAMVQVMDAMGYDLVIIETVGVGQDEVDIVQFADTSIVVLVPGLGDDIQADKAGLLEIADIFVLNKADRPGIQRLKREIRAMLNLHRLADVEGAFRPTICETTAVSGEGLDELIDSIDEHRLLTESGDPEVRRRKRQAHLVRAIARTEVEALFSRHTTSERFDDLIDQVSSGSLDPYAAADRLTRWLTE